MAWIQVIPEADAQGELRGLYSGLIEPWGGIDNIMKIHSLNPGSLEGHLRLYESLMRGPSDLSRVQREMIGVVVSALNHCRY